jgi:hypothetical protein
MLVCLGTRSVRSITLLTVMKDQKQLLTGRCSQRSTLATRYELIVEYK